MSVALRKESVDRNSNYGRIHNVQIKVALRKESVDRNVVGDVMGKALAESLSARRAWIEISSFLDIDYKTRSLSARRAWIEIRHTLPGYHVAKVALRKESVDRNDDILRYLFNRRLSLSARRAWIEIFVPFDVIRPAIGRSPQGERG